MQTSSIPFTLSGARQEPLLRAEQLRPGMILTGLGWSSVRRITEIEGTSSMWMVKVPQAPVPHGHIHHFPSGPGVDTSCSCGLRMEPIAGVLPVREGIVRTYILIPDGPLKDADPYTIYSNAAGLAAVITLEGKQWDQVAMPVVPLLRVAWTLPEAMRRVVEG